MPVPTLLTDLTKIADNNSPQGSETAKGTVDNYLRAAFGFIAQINALVGGSTVSLASSASVAIGAAQSANISITGTTTITGFDNVAEGALRWVTFAGALTLTHNAASLQLPGAANIVTAAGDVGVFKSLGGGNWKCMGFQRVSGVDLAPASASRDGYLSAADWSTFNNKLSTATAASTYLPKTGGAMTGPVLFAEGTQAAPGITFNNDGANDTGFYHMGDGVIGVTCNGVLMAKFSTAGLEVNKIIQTQ